MTECAINKEEDAITMPYYGGQQESGRIARSERTSSGQAMTGNLDAVHASSRKPSSAKSQEEFAQIINVEEPSPSEDFEYYETNVGKSISLFFLRTYMC